MALYAEKAYDLENKNKNYANTATEDNEEKISDGYCFSALIGERSDSKKKVSSTTVHQNI